MQRAQSRRSAASRDAPGEHYADQEALYELRSKMRRERQRRDVEGLSSNDSDDDSLSVRSQEDGPQEWLHTFNFQQRHGKLNVRRLARIDLVHIVEKVDIGALQEVLENIAFCNLKVVDLHGLSDQNIVKAFRLAQLIIEYLLNLENALFAQVEQARQKSRNASAEADQLAQDSRILADENDRLRKELRQKRKALATFEYVLTVHGPGGGSVKETLANALAGTRAGAGLDASSLEASVCSTCGKTFSTREFLRRHCARRKHTFHSSLEDAENVEPNRSTEASAELLEELRTSLLTAVKDRDQAVQEAIEHTRKVEREMHQEQLDRLKADSTSHQERIEAHYQERLTAQQLTYEQRIASLETKLEVFRTMQMAQSSETLKQQEQQQYKLELLERELKLQHAENEHLRKVQEATEAAAATTAAHQMLTQAAPKSLVQVIKEEEPTPPPLPASADLSSAIELTQRFRKAVAMGFCRSLANIVRRKDQAQLARSFSVLKVHSLDVSFAQAKVSLTRALESQRTEQSGALSPTDAVAKHVAKAHATDVSNDKDLRPISDKLANEIVLKYRHALREEAITETDRDAMDEVEELMDGRVAKLSSKYKIEAQAMDYAPIADKPFVKSRWSHTLSEIQTQKESIRLQLRNQMSLYDPALPEMDSLTEEQSAHLQRQIEITRRNQPEPNFHKALQAVNMLTEGLTETFYKPPLQQDLEDFEEEFPHPHDKLLQEALIPVSERRKARNRAQSTVIQRPSFSALHLTDDEMVQLHGSYNVLNDRGSLSEPPPIPNPLSLDITDDDLAQLRKLDESMRKMRARSETSDAFSQKSESDSEQREHEHESDDSDDYKDDYKANFTDEEDVENISRPESVQRNYQRLEHLPPHEEQGPLPNPPYPPHRSVPRPSFIALQASDEEMAHAQLTYSPSPLDNNLDQGYGFPAPNNAKSGSHDPSRFYPQDSHQGLDSHLHIHSHSEEESSHSPGDKTDVSPLPLPPRPSPRGSHTSSSVEVSEQTTQFSRDAEQKDTDRPVSEGSNSQLFQRNDLLHENFTPGQELTGVSLPATQNDQIDETKNNPDQEKDSNPYAATNDIQYSSTPDSKEENGDKTSREYQTTLSSSVEQTDTPQAKLGTSQSFTSGNSEGDDWDEEKEDVPPIREQVANSLERPVLDEDEDEDAERASGEDQEAPVSENRLATVNSLGETTKLDQIRNGTNIDGTRQDEPSSSYDHIKRASENENRGVIEDENVVAVDGNEDIQENEIENYNNDYSAQQSPIISPKPKDASPPSFISQEESKHSDQNISPMDERSNSAGASAHLSSPPPVPDRTSPVAMHADVVTHVSQISAAEIEAMQWEFFVDTQTQ